MTPTEQYRALAASLRRKAEAEGDLHERAEWGALSKLYDRLAQQADQNGRAGELYDPILKWRDKSGSEAQ